VCCSVWQCVAVCCSVLQCVAVCCSALNTVDSVVCCSVLQCVAVCCSVLQCVEYSRFTSVLQCVAVCGSVLQCVAVRCSALNTVDSVAGGLLGFQQVDFSKAFLPPATTHTHTRHTRTQTDFSHCLANRLFTRSQLPYPPPHTQTDFLHTDRLFSLCSEMTLTRSEPAFHTHTNATHTHERTFSV